MIGTASQFRRLVAVVVLPIFLYGCTTWEVQTVAPAQSIAEAPDKVRVTLTNGSEQVLENPQMVNDTLLSGEQNATTSLYPLSSIEHLAFKKTKLLATIMTVVGAVVVVGLVFISVVCTIGNCAPGGGG